MDYKKNFIQLLSFTAVFVVCGLYLGFETAVFHNVATFMIIAYVALGAFQVFWEWNRKRKK